MNSNFPIPISLQPDVGNLWYFNLSLVTLLKFIVCRSLLLDCKDIEIRKLEFVAKTRLWVNITRYLPVHFMYQAEFQLHTCMPITLASDPIRVQSCVYCLFWTNRDCMAVTSFILSISLSNESLNQWMEIFTSTETIVKLDLYSTNTDYMRLNGAVRQMNDPPLVKFMW